MIRKLTAVVATLTALALPFAAHATEDGVLAKVGTLGAGVEYVHPFSSHSALRFGVNGASQDENSTESGINYNFKLKLKSASALFDFHPFAGTFFTSLGVFYNKNEIDASSSGNLTIGSQTANTTLTGEITFNSVAPYVGLGWGHAPSGKGLSFAFELGVLFQGAPKVTLQSSNTAVTQSNLDQEAAELEDSLKNNKYYPQVAFALGYRF